MGAGVWRGSQKSRAAHRLSKILGLRRTTKLKLIKLHRFFLCTRAHDILNTPRAHVRLAPEHWYEDASKNMWTGHLGLWTRHFREIDEQLATLMDPRVSIAQSLERIAHALEDSSEPRYRGALASLPGALERQ